MPTPTQQILDRVYAPATTLLKAAGFKKKGRTLFRIGNDCADVVNFQASQWNSADHVRFTANLGVYQSDLAKQLNRLRDPLPREFAECMLDERIGWVMPDKLDIWWQVDAEHSEERAATSFSEAIERWALPWFQRCRSRDTLIQFLIERTGWHPADMLLLLGERDLAINAMNDINPNNPGRTDAITRWRLKHGIPET